VLCTRCHEREVPDRPPAERLDGLRRVDAELVAAVEAFFAAVPEGVCGECLRRDPEGQRRLYDRMRAVVDRLNRLLLPRLAGEHFRRYVLRLLDLADGMVERFQAAKR
jgi:hypothetical protein